jgi:glyoxylase-like metal-dependent hydrolase (beta-lactamase superfamily II)
MVDTLGDRDPDMINLQVVLPQITLDTHIQLFSGDITVTLLAAANGVLWVWLPEQQVLFVGDTVVVGVHPPLTVVDVHEWLVALDQLQQKPQFQDAMLVPGRGPLCDISATEPLIEYLHTASKLTQEVYQAGRPKADLNGVAAELVPLCPVPDGQWERVQRQIKLGLDEMYDGFKAADVAMG